MKKREIIKFKKGDYCNIDNLDEVTHALPTKMRKASKKEQDEKEINSLEIFDRDCEVIIRY